MAGIAVVTDASTCLPEALAAALDIRILPISATGELDEPEGDAETTWRLPEAVEQAELGAANRPFVTEYLAAIERPGVEAAVIVTPAIEFAAMFRNAALAAELADRPAVAIDGRSAAAGQALVVLAGAEVACQGGDLDDVVRAIESASHRVELVASLATLDPIRSNGPLPESVLEGPVHSGARTVFRMRSGTVEMLGGAADADETLRTIHAAYLESAARGIERSTVFHAGAPSLAARLEQLVGGVDFVCGFSTAMQVHTGRGVVGAAWLPKAEQR
jgi:fatty acid-binding protein DegV